MAGAAAVALLQLSHYGGAGDLFRAADGCGGLPSVARKAILRPLGPMAAPSEFPAALYRKYGRVDDSGNRTAAVGRLWTNPHVGGLLQVRLGRKWTVHSARLHGNVHRAFHALHRSGLSNRSKGT